MAFKVPTFLKISEQISALSIRSQCVCRIREKFTLIFHHCMTMPKYVSDDEGDEVV